jgi:hypothetical protein
VIQKLIARVKKAAKAIGLEEFIEQFKHINGKYLTEFKAQMLLNLISGENHE